MSRGPLAVVVATAGAVGLAACTLTHPLDGYSDGYGAADGAPGSDDAGDGAGGDAGCVGDPVLLEPADNATVGATMRVRVSAPSCIQTMILYIDSQQTFHVTGSAMDQSFPVSVGTHKVNVNGWAGTDKAHTSPIVTVRRAQ